MRNLTIAVMVAALLAGVWWVWPNEERRVRARVRALADAASTAAGESDLTRVSRLAALARGLAADVVVEIGPAGARPVQGRDAVLGLAAQLSRVNGPIAFRVDGMDVAVTEDGLLAIVQATVSAEAESPLEGRRFDAQEIRLELGQVDGAWVVRRAQPISALIVPR